MKITQRQLRQIIREELSKSLTELDLSPFPGQQDKSKLIVVPGTKVRHEKTRLLYTVDDVESDSEPVDLEQPDGEIFSVTIKQFEEEYDLD